MTALPNLEIIPASEIRFTGPYDGSTVKTQLVLRNHHDKPVAFKVKTTTPKRYCVRPNASVVEANSSTEIAIMLQSFDLSSEEVNRHKFLIQSAFASEPYDSAAFWAAIPADQIVEKRLRCVLEGYPEAASPPQHGDGISTPSHTITTDTTAVPEAVNCFHTSNDKSSMHDTSSNEVSSFVEKKSEALKHAEKARKEIHEAEHNIRERKVMDVSSSSPMSTPVGKIAASRPKRIDLVTNPISEASSAATMVVEKSQWTTLQTITMIMLAFTIGILVCNMVNKYFR